MGTLIFLQLCCIAALFLVYCLVQFGREWKKLHDTQAQILHVRTARIEPRVPAQVLPISNWNRAAASRADRRMVS